MNTRYTQDDIVNYGYRIDSKPDPMIVELVEQFLDQHAPAFETLGISRPTVAFVRGLGKGHLARYVKETASDPLLVFDAKAIIKTARKYDVALTDGVESTLLHEYGHIYVDSVGAYLDPDDEERIVEEYAKYAWSRADYVTAAEVLAAEVEKLK